jgi:hypothetical protein
VVANGRPYEVTTFRKDVQTDGRHAVAYDLARIVLIEERDGLARGSQAGEVDHHGLAVIGLHGAAGVGHAAELLELFVASVHAHLGLDPLDGRGGQ